MMSPITTAQPSSLHSQSSNIDHQSPKRSTSTSERISQKIRSNLRHLRLGGGGGGGGGGGSNHHEEQQKGPEFRIVHTPDRPVRLVSPLEAPTEEECFDEIKGWHSAAAAGGGGGGGRSIQSQLSQHQQFIPVPERIPEPVPEQIPVPKPLPAPPPQLPPVEFDSHRFGLGLGLGISPLSSLNLDDEEEQHQQKILTKRGESPMLGGGNFEQQGYGIFEFEDPEADTDNNNNNNHTGKETKSDKDPHRKGKYILQPVPVPVPLPTIGRRQYYPRRDSFVSDDDNEDDNHNSNRRVEEEKGDIKPWESRSLPPSPSPSPSTPHFQIHRNGNGKLVAARLLNYHRYSPSYPTSTTSAAAAAASSGSQLNTPSRGGGGGGGSSEKQFKLELEDSDLDVRGGSSKDNESQMQNLWSYLRRTKNHQGGQRKSEGLVSNFSSTGTSSDEYYSHDGEDAEIHEAQVVDLELRRKMERFRRRGDCPYCGGQVHFRESDFSSSSGGTTEPPPGSSYFCGFCRADLRGVVYGDYGVQEQRMVMGTGAGQPAVVETAGRGREEVRARQRPDRGYDATKPYVTTGSSHSERKVTAPPGTVPPKPLRQRALLEQRASDGGRPTGSRGDLRGQAVSHGGFRQENLGQQNTGRDQIPANSSKPQPGPVGARKYQQEEAQSSKFSSSVDSSSSAASLTPRKPPLRLTDRPILAEAKGAPSPPLAQQLRHRPAPPPPERTVYANDTRNARGRYQTVKQTSAPSLSGKQAAPSPQRHETTRKQANHYYSGPLLPATVYRPLPPLPDEQGQGQQAAPRTAPLPSRPFPQPPLVPRSSQSPGYVNPSSPGLSTSSRPNQSRPLNPEQLQPAPHRPNHSSPLLNHAFTPARPSPHAPGPPRPSASLPARPRQEAPPLLPQTRHQQHMQPPRADINYTAASPFAQQLPIRPPDPRLNQLSKQPNSNLLASALEQATRNARDQLAVPEPPSASSSTYSPLNESPTTPTASIFSSTANTTTGDSRAATLAPQRTNPFSTSSSSHHQTHMYPYHSAPTQDGLNIITPAPNSHAHAHTHTRVQAQPGTQDNRRAGTEAVPPPSATEITPSSAQIPMLRYDDAMMPWMTPQDKANFDKAIADKGDDAQVYMDIFDDYAGYSSSVSSSSIEDEEDGEKNKKK